MTAEEELALDIARSLVHDHSYLYVLEEAYNNDLDADQVVGALAVYRLRGGFWERVATYNRETKEMF